MNADSKILIVEDQFVEANHLRLMLKKHGYTASSMARSVADAKEQIRKEKPDLVLLDIYLSGRETGIDLAKVLKKENIPFIYISANSNEHTLNEAKATQPNGFLVKPFREKDLMVSMEIARYHQEHGLESSIRKEALFQKQLKALAGRNDNWQQRLLQVSHALQPLIPFDFLLTSFRTEEYTSDHIYGFLRTGFNEYQQIGVKEFQRMAPLKEYEVKQYQDAAPVEETVSWYTGVAFEQTCEATGMKQLIAKNFGMRSCLTLPLPLAISGKGMFVFSFFSRHAHTFSEKDADLCERLQQPLIFTVENMLANDKRAFAGTGTATASVINPADTSGDNFRNIIGKSPSLLTVFDLISQVAPSDTSVLITGESGTGKERIAESIHQHSPRKNGPFIRINCGALPPNLIESELFGHEKGSFTGATDRRTGKFEQAAGGTIFLDEIGEMQLDMQVKLLRVLQEKEIERIGGKKPVKVDIRIVAATNRVLEKEVAEGRFRLDLYYRLNVFPIQAPPLRERKEDIHLLTQHFLRQFSQKTGKNVTRINSDALKSLISYHWPGNIRELENLVERSVLLAKGTEIENISLPASKEVKDAIEKADWYIRTIEENEREHIIAVLNKCNGRIRGTGGAAQLLGVPPTTLASKIKKLGIKKEFKD